MNRIAILEENYKTFTNTSKDIGSKIAAGVSMLQLSDANSSVAEAVMQIEALTHKGEGPSFISKLPLLGKYLVKAKRNLDHESLKSAKVVDVVDRLFNSLNDKKEDIMKVMYTLFELKEQLASEVNTMIEQEAEAKDLATSDETSNFEKSKAKNLLVQVSQSIIKCKDRIGIIDATCKSAEASTMAISSLLPALQGELITEMAIQGGLQELKEFKAIFDNTMRVVTDLTKENNASMVKVLEDVIDLSVTRPSDIALLESNATSREATQAKLHKKLEDARRQQDSNISTLITLRSNQKTLGYCE